MIQKVSQQSEKKSQQQLEYFQKVNLATLYNQNEDYQTYPQTSKKADIKQIERFHEILNEKIVNLVQLKDISWHGVPDDLRSTVWKLLLNYSPPNKDAQSTILDRKRTQYYEMCEIYFSNEAASLYDDREKKIIKLIQSDITRNNPSSTLFRNTSIQEMLKRILFIWNVRNPACGYVQGINDIVSVFLIVFLSEFVDINTAEVSFVDEKQMDHLDSRISKKIEADCYWCLSKMLDCVIDNYTQEQPGLLRYFNRLTETLAVLDKPLLDHFEQLQINLYTGFIFKWNNCLLLRLFSFDVGLRLFDTFIAEENSKENENIIQDFLEFSIFIVATILLKHSKKIKKMPQEEAMFFMEKIPTKQWSEYDLNLCLAEAYSYKQILQKK